MRLTYGHGTASVTDAKNDIKKNRGRVLIKAIKDENQKIGFGFFLQDVRGNVFDICQRGRAIKMLTSAGPAYDFLKNLDPNLLSINWPILCEENVICFGHGFENYEQPHRKNEENVHPSEL